MKDFSSLFLGSSPQNKDSISRDANESATDELSHNILEILSLFPSSQFYPFIRLFMLLHNVLGRSVGINPAHIFTFFAVVWAAQKLWHQLYSTSCSLLRQYCMASIDISSNDDTFMYLKWWLASQQNLSKARFLTAETVPEGELEGDGDPELQTHVSPDGSNRFNVSNHKAKARLRFTPSLGAHPFWYRCRPFILERKQASVFHHTVSAHETPRFEDKEYIVLSTFGLSAEPIKQLLQHVKKEYYHSHKAKTVVWYPSNQTIHNFHPWRVAPPRPICPLTTVVLDNKQKTGIVEDVYNFFLRETVKFYADRGIPHCRGYLLHGPPGTGKTSLCYALAGAFGLDIYSISLKDKTLTDTGLLELFISIPPKSIVLLEDIDAAGLKRTDESSIDLSSLPSSSSSSSSSEEDNARSHRGKNKHDESPQKHKNSSGSHGHQCQDNNSSGISLAGLLNSIDGIASQEGRILIMTTNKPDDLDEALICPGRIDMQVGFTMTTREQARDLFLRMYEPGSEKVMATPKKRSPRVLAFLLSFTPFSELSSTKVFTATSSKDDNTTDHLSELAVQFADQIPPGKFSQAEIQGYLLKRKYQPRRALEEVEEWVQNMLETKRLGTNVLRVQ
ncbi:hypothetical protein VTH82DRAFT_1408 [Thermothelomyces myriococcoides]